MGYLFLSLCAFITTPVFRWCFIFISIVIHLLKYYNEPQRFSYKSAWSGLSFKWHLFGLAILSCISYTLMTLSLWISVPFTQYLPDNWFIYLFIICIGILTQITIDTKQISDDGSFNPPPEYMFSDKYRILLQYISLILNIVVMMQTYIYVGVSDYSKKTIISRYILERFGGWNIGNKLDFIYEWAGFLDILISIYLLYITYTFQACDYDLPASWNF